MRRKKSKEQRLKSFLIPKLRRFSRWWPERARALHAAKHYIQVDTFKNGKPKFTVKFQCAKCKDLFNKEDVSMDHIHPVVQVSGFTTWDAYVNRMFCDESGYQCLCNSCHDRKSAGENKQRKNNRYKHAKKS